MTGRSEHDCGGNKVAPVVEGVVAEDRSRAKSAVTSRSGDEDLQRQMAPLRTAEGNGGQSSSLNTKSFVVFDLSDSRTIVSLLLLRRCLRKVGARYNKRVDGFSMAFFVTGGIFVATLCGFFLATKVSTDAAAMINLSTEQKLSNVAGADHPAASDVVGGANYVAGGSSGLPDGGTSRRNTDEKNHVDASRWTTTIGVFDHRISTDILLLVFSLYVSVMLATLVLVASKCNEAPRFRGALQRAALTTCAALVDVAGGTSTSDRSESSCSTPGESRENVDTTAEKWRRILAHKELLQTADAQVGYEEEVVDPVTVLGRPASVVTVGATISAIITGLAVAFQGWLSQNNQGWGYSSVDGVWRAPPATGGAPPFVIV